MAGGLVLKYWESIKKKDAARIAKQAVPDFDDAVLDVSYADDGHPLHTLNVYRPKGSEGKLPVIMDVHGGGWYYGDKELNSYYCRSLVRHGFAVVDISYRLSPECTVYEQVQDVFSAMAYVNKHTDEFGLDMDNFFIAGDSAGGHIVGLVANIVKSKQLQEVYKVQPCVDIKGAGLICPAADPLGFISAPKSLMKIYFNGVFGKGYLKDARTKYLSYFEILQKDICPCFFITSYGDFLKKQTVEAYEVTKAQGTKVGLHFIESNRNPEHKLVHVYNVLYWDWEESEEANLAMTDFFKEVMTDK